MWAQPWAWLGLAGLAVPIAIHLLARHQAVRAAFPTLRFIDASELNAIKRQRLTDIPLLLVRLLMIALAVAAIAGPRFGAAAVAASEEPAHVTVYDMTASAASGRSDSFVEGTRSRRARVDAGSLRAGLDAAVAWAVRQPGEREITVVSDFQRGAIDDAAVRLVPAGIGLKFERVRSTPRPMPQGLSVDADRVRMTWPVAPPPSPNVLSVLAGAEQEDAERMLAAVLSVTPVAPIAQGADRHVATFVFPGAPERAALLRGMTPIDEAWMFGAARDLLARWPAQVRVGVSEPSVSQLMVILDFAPGSLDAAEAVARVAAGLDAVVPTSESDPRLIDDAQLKSWERTTERAVVERAGEPQGRWLWMAVVALLAVETGMRRRAA